MDKKSKKKNTIIGIIISLILVVAFIVVLLIALDKNKSMNEKESGGKDNNVSSPYRMSSKGVQDFDLYFLKNGKSSNIVYSPISIKYALAMLSEGAEGNTKEEITKVIGDYTPKKYTNSKNMSFANVIFIKETYKNLVNSNFISTLQDKYNAEVKYDKFESANNINSWISDKTLNLINNMVDNIDESQKYILINALGIDMEWQSKFIFGECEDCTTYTSYNHESFGWLAGDSVKSGKFKGVEEDVAVMEIAASYNNYDIIKELGEENIRKTVKEEYRKYLNEYEPNLSSSEVEKEIERYLDEYIEGIKANYKKHSKTTEFSMYVDDDIKVFAKDLKTYGDTTLQYVAIMPQNEELDKYVGSLDSTKLDETLGKLKELKNENFKDGVVTKIKGYIPKFKFEYNIDLVKDLKELGISDIFDENKANLSIISDEKTSIGVALHKSNIEFTQDGIKASAATMAGGLGAGFEFDYNYDVPVEEIDLTFDKPYMFIIREKSTGEVWFLGSVYTPSLWKNDPDNY